MFLDFHFLFFRFQNDGKSRPRSVRKIILFYFYITLVLSVFLIVKFEKSLEIIKHEGFICRYSYYGVDRINRTLPYFHIITDFISFFSHMKVEQYINYYKIWCISCNRSIDLIWSTDFCNTSLISLLS